MKRRPLVALLALVAAGCAQVSKVADGDVVIKERLVVTVQTPWNQFERTMSDHTTTWTNEGITVDALQFYVAVKDGELLASTPSEPKSQRVLTFKASMQAADVVGLYQSLWTRDGSSFTLERIEPQPFIGANGFRFEYTLLRKVDDVRLQGVAYGAIRNGELYVINYHAPRLAFFARYLPRVEALAKSARVRS